jgi:WD40 repeat protein
MQLEPVPVLSRYPLRKHPNTSITLYIIAGYPMRRIIIVLFLGCMVAAITLQAQTSRTIYTSPQGIQAVEWSRDGSRLAIADGNRTLTIWDAAADTAHVSLHVTIGPITSVRWNSTGTKVAFGTSTVIGIWNMQSDTIRTLAGNEGSVRGIAWSPDDSMIASACGTGNSKSFKIWNIEEQKILFNLDTADEGYGCSNRHVAWDPDGSRLIATGSCGYVGTIYDPTNGQIVAHLETNTNRNNSVAGLSYSPDAKEIVVGHYSSYITICNARTGNARLTLEYDTMGYQNVVAWNPGNDLIISGDRDGELTAWNATTGVRLKTFIGHAGAVTALSWNRDGSHLASSGVDGTVKIWDVTAESIASSIGVTTAADAELSIAPNPTRDELRVTYSSSKPGTVVISLADITGATVTAIERQVHGNGEELTVINLAHVPNGIYRLVVRMPDGTIKQRMVEVVR